jgi:hypothetical protein
MLVLGNSPGVHTDLLDVFDVGSIRVAGRRSPLAAERDSGEPCPQQVCPMSTPLGRVREHPDTPWRERFADKSGQVMQQRSRNHRWT